MSDDRTDVDAVRTFMFARAESMPSAVGALRARVLTGPVRQAPVPVLRRRWLVPLVAAALALVTAVGVGYVVARPPVTVPADSHPPIVRGASLDVAQAFADLRAAAAQASPVVIPSGSLLYRRQDASVYSVEDMSFGTVVAGSIEDWSEPADMVMVKTLNHGGLPSSGTPEPVAQQRAEFAGTGPGPLFPTPAWLAQLPTDPDALAAALTPAVSVYSSPFHAYVALFSRADPLLPVGLRVALLHLIERLPGIGVTGVTLAGTRLDAVHATDGSLETDLLLDPGTGHAVGYATYTMSLPASAADSPASSVGGPAEAMHVRWTFAVVAHLPG